jgi:hypothetical protein
LLLSNVFLTSIPRSKNIQTSAVENPHLQGISQDLCSKKGGHIYQPHVLQACWPVPSSATFPGGDNAWLEL